MAGMIAALDADVLVPILACDFLLTAFDHGLYQPVVSENVLGEVQRTLRSDFPKLDGAAITYRVDAMREVLADQLIEPDSTDLQAAVNVYSRPRSSAKRRSSSPMTGACASRSQAGCPALSRSAWTSSGTHSPSRTRRRSRQ